MQESKKSLDALDWIKAAKKDWHRMEKMLEHEDTEAAGYFFRHTLEKYLKAFLLQHGWKLKKIQALPTLLDDAVKYNANLESFRELCERVSGYYLTERYPALVDTRLTCEDIEKDIEEAKRFIKVLSS